MKRVIKIESTQNPNIINFTWSVTNTCNYACRYCFPDANTGTHPAPTNLDLVVKNLSHLFDQYRIKLNKNKIRFSLAGGEPTLWRGLEFVITELKKKHDIYFSIISNGSRTTRWWRENAHLIDNATLSMHIEQGNIDHMIEVADILYAAGTKTTVKVMMDAQHWQASVDAIIYMKKHSKYPWIIITDEVIEDPRPFSQEQRSFLSKNLHRIPSIWWIIKNIKLVLKGFLRRHESIATLQDGTRVKAERNYYTNNLMNSFTGWQCDIGIETVYVNWDGNITGSCAQILFGLDKPFNIYDENFTTNFDVEFKPSICTLRFCFCGPEMHTSKFKL